MCPTDKDVDASGQEPLNIIDQFDFKNVVSLTWGASKSKTISKDEFFNCMYCFSWGTGVHLDLWSLRHLLFRGVGRPWANKALEGQTIVLKQWLAPPMLCLLRAFRCPCFLCSRKHPCMTFLNLSKPSIHLRVRVRATKWLVKIWSS